MVEASPSPQPEVQISPSPAPDAALCAEARGKAAHDALCDAVDCAAVAATQLIGVDDCSAAGAGAVQTAPAASGLTFFSDAAGGAIQAVGTGAAADDAALAAALQPALQVNLTDAAVTELALFVRPSEDGGAVSTPIAGAAASPADGADSSGSQRRRLAAAVRRPQAVVGVRLVTQGAPGAAPRVHEWGAAASPGARRVDVDVGSGTLAGVTSVRAAGELGSRFEGGCS